LLRKVRATQRKVQIRGKENSGDFLKGKKFSDAKKTREKRKGITGVPGVEKGDDRPAGQPRGERKKGGWFRCQRRCAQHEELALYKGKKPGSKETRKSILAVVEMRFGNHAERKRTEIWGEKKVSQGGKSIPGRKKKRWGKGKITPSSPLKRECGSRLKKQQEERKISNVRRQKKRNDLKRRSGGKRTVRARGDVKKKGWNYWEKRGASCQNPALKKPFWGKGLGAPSQGPPRT